MTPQTKTMQVVMLPTEKASKLSILKSGKLNYGAEIMSSNNSKPQHLYIVSDAEIKEGDWYVENFKYVLKCGGMTKCLVDRVCKKIEATTDIGLYFVIEEEKEFPHHPIPQIPDSFLNVYINAGGKISEVDVEMEEKLIHYTGEHFKRGNYETEIIGIKTNPDNTIIIHLRKTYTRNEVENLLRKALKNAHEFTYKYEATNSFIDKWIQNNL